MFGITVRHFWSRLGLLLQFDQVNQLKSRRVLLRAVCSVQSLPVVIGQIRTRPPRHTNGVSAAFCAAHPPLQEHFDEPIA